MELPRRGSRSRSAETWAKRCAPTRRGTTRIPVASRFVDCHSHVLPAGDDGAQTLEEARLLCRGAAAHGTAVLFATPHVWPTLPLTPRRQEAIARAHAELRPAAGLELRLGYELTPGPALLEDDPRRYELEGTGCVLMEVPFAGPPDDLWALAEHVERAGLVPVIGHPERSEAGLLDPALPAALAERGWVLQVNATSLLGRHGRQEHDLGWSLVERGIARLVASDGHRTTRPPHLDEAHALVRARLGEAGERLFDGSALGLGRESSAVAS